MTEKCKLLNLSWYKIFWYFPYFQQSSAGTITLGHLLPVYEVPQKIPIFERLLRIKPNTCGLPTAMIKQPPGSHVPRRHFIQLKGNGHSCSSISIVSPPYRWWQPDQPRTLENTLGRGIAVSVRGAEYGYRRYRRYRTTTYPRRQQASIKIFLLGFVLLYCIVVNFNHIYLGKEKRFWHVGKTTNFGTLSPPQHMSNF